MGVPQIHTVISTGHSLTNTYNQLIGLQQEERALRDDLQRLESGSRLAAEDEIARLQFRLNRVNTQIHQILNTKRASPAESIHYTDSSDQLTISSEAYLLFRQ